MSLDILLLVVNIASLLFVSYTIFVSKKQFEVYTSTYILAVVSIVFFIANIINVVRDLVIYS